MNKRDSRDIKIAHINIFFKLPDDFQGDYNDILLEVIKYRKENKLPPYPKEIIEEPKEEEVKALQDSSKFLWGRFVKALEHNYKICGAVSLSEFKDGKWKHIKEGDK